MFTETSERSRKLQNEVREFMDAHVYSAEHVYEQQLDEMENRWSVVPVMEELKAKAKSAGLWNLFLPESERGAGLTKACGTGACAAQVAAVRRGLTDRKATVVVDGGELTIDWDPATDHVLMTGPVEVERTGALAL